MQLKICPDIPETSDLTGVALGFYYRLTMIYQHCLVQYPAFTFYWSVRKHFKKTRNEKGHICNECKDVLFENKKYILL